MTRREKALLSSNNREVNGDVEFLYYDGSWHGCCPGFLNSDIELDKETCVGDDDHLTGCRGITCVECWSKEAPREEYRDC